MKRERPNLILRKDGKRAVPISAFDEEQFDALPNGCEIDGAPRSKRSNQQLRLYWSTLSHVCKATGIAPDAKHLHRLLKVDLGYVTLVALLDGSLAAWPDSVALDEMEQPEFQAYFDNAMRRLAEVTGFDPMQTLQAAA